MFEFPGPILKAVLAYVGYCLVVVGEVLLSSHTVHLVFALSFISADLRLMK